jgi:methanethiol oxidase
VRNATSHAIMISRGCLWHELFMKGDSLKPGEEIIMRQWRWLFASLVLVTGCMDSEEEGATELENSQQYNLPREKLMYITAINVGAANPDMLFTVGVNPNDPATYGKIINRTDMANVGDEVHHVGYSHDRNRLLVPGIFSGRMSVLDIKSNPKKPTLKTTADLANSGYIVPHTVIPYRNGKNLVTMIGAATATSGPGGIIVVDDQTGSFIEHWGPGPVRPSTVKGPTYMYDFDFHNGVGISTTFGLPANIGGGINPAGLGSTIAIWDVDRKKVTKEVNLGTNHGALEVRFLKKDRRTRGYINTPGTSAVWYFEDEDCNGDLTFHQVLGPEDNLALPVDMLLSYDQKFMYVTNWAGNTVQQWNISDRQNPQLVGQATVPHANMLRLSTDGKRLYVTNGLLSTWDNDPALGGPRNTNYGLWAYNVNTTTGGLTSLSAGDTPWVQFDSVQKKASVGAAGVHMMLFDAAATIDDHH